MISFIRSFGGVAVLIILFNVIYRDFGFEMVIIISISIMIMMLSRIVSVISDFGNFINEVNITKIKITENEQNSDSDAIQ